MKRTELLLVDAGNTRLKWLALHDKDTPPNFATVVQQAEAYAQQETPQTGSIRVLQQLLARHKPERMVIVHVLEQGFTRPLRELCQQNQCDLLLVNVKKNAYGIKSAYANPAHLGADRLVALVAARFFAQQPSQQCPQQFAQQPAAIIIDCGTAVTIDAWVTDEQSDGQYDSRHDVQYGSQHLGGLILPGLSLLSDSLIRRTQAKHMASSVFENAAIFADNTAQGIGSGCLFSLVGAIEGICQRMQNEMVGNPVKIICGGDAERIHPHLLGDYRLEPAALMMGLWVIAGQG